MSSRIANPLGDFGIRRIGHLGPSRLLLLRRQVHLGMTRHTGGRDMSVAEAEESTIRGDHDDALRTLEAVLADTDHAEFASAARIAATIHAHRGTLNRSAELLQMVAPEALGDSAAAGA